MTDSRYATAYIALGSNLDTPRQHVERAVTQLRELPVTHLTRCSRLYASKPVGPQDQPDFVNAVVEVITQLSPLALLDQLQALEQRHGRERSRHWGPRTLDLDLLLHGDTRMQTSRLVLPHPHMHERAFVLVPLADIAGNLTLPGDIDVATLADKYANDDLRVLLP
ncbi:2-amino-4-hydroxy-6-hydroxymethyldihydropteridine diphosphokinase [Aidingimonas halophila]|uniref:2-amino-4-hydroxy-6-hydroxymethyldihydropteridine pyrophosphokinase n=1 Tax=Aidingimonas halophila TaxID=574349 RepID=A0A1H2YCT6_9GAMM|nr:2-amino-4-hydroxy-6-hydroxymethyldihydropteridine diphosphokinase [Aidingimonas halophila]GHC34804.1 2-amino-4-hydroxy-6-hydroxymethyldihydropteridine pyrophosphokinase [Aidingimonas halophila]SDX02870.1 2-amino-4-hydroxy-6-hydroxymethyldihydropteridinediphosphokinase [Aidingimonas halophila]